MQSPYGNEHIILEPKPIPPQRVQSIEVARLLPIQINLPIEGGIVAMLKRIGSWMLDPSNGAKGTYGVEVSSLGVITVFLDDEDTAFWLKMCMA